MGPAQGQFPSELEQVRAAPEFGAHTPLAEKLLAVAIRAQNFTGSTGVAIALTEGDAIVCRANWGTSAPEVGARLSLENSFTGLCVRSGEPLRCNDAQSDPRVDPEACQALGISAIAAAPVRRGLKVVGVIAAFSDTPNAFTDKHLLILTTLADVVVELLEDPNPVRPLPQISTPSVPDLGRAAAVVQASPGEGMDKAHIPTTVLEDSVAPPAAAEPTVAFRSLGITASSEPAVGTAPFAAASADAPTPEAASPPPSECSAPAVPPQADPPTPRRRAMDRLVSPFKRNEILPTAADPGAPPDPVSPELSGGSAAPPAKTSPAAEGAAPRLTLVKPSQPAAAPVPDFIADLRFSEVEGAPGERPRWLLPAAILAIFAILAFVAWRVHVARSARKAQPFPTVTAPDPVPAPAAQPELAQPQKLAPADSPHVVAESPPHLADAPRPAAKPVPEPEQPEDVTIHHDPQPVVAVAGPVRRAATGNGASKALLPETQAPQLALVAPDLPALAKPIISIVGPASRFVPARLIHRVEPVYPQTARRLRLSGKVVVKATVTRAGSVANVQWVSGSEMFRESAIAAVKQWRYQPGSLDSQPVESELEIVLRFSSATLQ